MTQEPSTAKPKDKKDKWEVISASTISGTVYDIQDIDTKEFICSLYRVKHGDLMPAQEGERRATLISQAPETARENERLREGIHATINFVNGQFNPKPGTHEYGIIVLLEHALQKAEKEG